MRIRYIYIFAIAFLFLANNSSFPVGQTGAPGDSFCGSCHNSNNPNFDGGITIDGLPSSITPSTLYNITVTVSNPNGNASKAGFSIVALNSNNQNSGDFSNNQGGTLKTSGGREYFGHQPGINFPTNNEVTWTVDWTSPASATTVTMYGAGVIANGNGANSQDKAVIVNVSGSVVPTPPVSVQITGISSTSCWNSADGGATAQASGGTGSFTYSWDNGATTQTVNNLSPGNHSVTVTSGSSSQSASAFIPSPPILNVSITVQDQISCNGGSDGAIIAVGNGGTGSFNYHWSNGSNGASITGLSSGFYDVTATDANGCNTSTSVFLDEPFAIDVQNENVSNISCNGQSDGSISFVPSGGTGSLSTTWSNGQSGNVIFDLSPGTYVATITDANSCFTTKSYTISQPAAINITVQSTTNASCQGVADGSANVTANGGFGTLGYLWSNGAVGPNLSNVVAGVYTVLVTDANSCTSSKTVTIGANSTASLSLSSTSNVTCYGGSNGAASVQIQNGNGYTIQWSNGQTGNNLINVPSGSYTASGINGGGCITNEILVNIGQPNAITDNGSIVTQISCNNLNDGSILAQFQGGTGNLTYAWSNNATDPLIENLSAGIYTATITDAASCIETKSFTIVNPAPLSIQATSTVNNQCFGEMNGSITTTSSGGTGTISTNWSNGDMGSSISNLMAGEYIATSSDINGCSVSQTYIITQPTEIAVIMSGENESAAGAMDGMAFVSVSQGSPGYMYLWTTGQITDTISNLEPGLYKVTVTDANGCTKVGQVNISSGDCALAATVESTNVSCFGLSDGTIQLDVANSIGPVDTIITSSVAGPYDLNAMLPGSYDIQIVDSLGCSFNINNIVITQPTELGITVENTIDATGSTKSDGGANVTVTGGTSPYSYSWKRIDETEASNVEDPRNLSPGDYILVIMDANGCESESENVTIDFISGIKEASEFFVTIYPNPISNEIFIESKDKIQKVVLFTTDGRAISKQVSSQDGTILLDVSDLKSGCYIMQVQGSKGTLNRKILKI